METKKIIGIMSGTSLDGVDVSLTEISGKGYDLKVKLLDSATFSYSRKLKEELLKSSDSTTSTVDMISTLNFYLGEIFAECALYIIQKNDLSSSDIFLIASHGQTICHIPKGNKFQGKSIKSTFQIGEPSVIAERTGITTIADFRTRDVASGGDGAPLTPLPHYIFFNSKKKNRLVINIGGITNITFLPKNSDFSKISAFDTGPGNMLIDLAVSILTRKKHFFDEDGLIAKKGNVNLPLLRVLKSHPFLKRTPPKSTGREEFGELYLKHLLSRFKKKMSVEDFIATLTFFTPFAIKRAVKDFLSYDAEIDEIIVGGGGVKNKTMIWFLKGLFENSKVLNFSEAGADPDFFEAEAFALLGYLTTLGLNGNIPSVTGAHRGRILGKIIPGKNFSELIDVMKHNRA